MTDRVPDSPSQLKSGLNTLSIPYKSKDSISNSPSSLHLKSRNSRKFNELSSSSSFSKINKYTNTKESNLKKDEDVKSFSHQNLKVITEKSQISKEDSNIHKTSSNILSPAYRRSPLVRDFTFPFPYEKDSKLSKPLTSPIVTSSYPYHSSHLVRPASPHVTTVHSLPPTNKEPTILLNNDYENPIKTQRYSPTSTHLAGWLLLFTTYAVFVLGMYSVVFSKIMSDTGNPVLDSIKHDNHYCYLIPLLIVVIYLFIFVNWFSMKLFIHN
jgi:hypothetical protein